MKRLLIQVFGVILMVAASGCASLPGPKKVSEREQNKADTLFELGTKHLLGQRTGQAIQVLTEASEANPNSAKIFNNLGIAYHEIGNVHAAKENFKRALLIDKNHSDAWVNLGKLKLTRGENTLARRLFKMALKDPKYPGRSLAFSNMGQSYLNQNKPKKAQMFFKRAMSIDPENCSASLGMASTFEKMRKFRASNRLYRKAVGTSCTERPFAHFRLARSYKLMKNYSAAKNKLKFIVTRFPDSSVATAAKRELAKLSKGNN